MTPEPNFWDMSFNPFNFSAICLSETWYESTDVTKNSNYKLNGYR